MSRFLLVKLWKTALTTLHPDLVQGTEFFMGKCASCGWFPHCLPLKWGFNCETCRTLTPPIVFLFQNVHDSNLQPHQWRFYFENTGFQLTTPVLWFYTLNHYPTSLEAITMPPCNGTKYFHVYKISYLLFYCWSPQDYSDCVDCLGSPSQTSYHCLYARSAES